ncbi:MAG: zinc metallopeptidase [Lachnospiraceae bacterium]|nr:zinc metallopeptidase [Lachnospiraceae bacterium]
MYLDPTYILVIIGAIICMIASANMNATYRKYSNVGNMKGKMAWEVAEDILHSAGIYDVRIEHVAGNLTDHYSSKEKVLRLSDSVYNSTSIAALGVAAHECGHAIQHSEQYAPLSLRSAAVPVANIGSFLYWPVILIGLVFGQYGIAQIGLFLFMGILAFQIITLPVEFNASKRAMEILRSRSILYDNELPYAGKVLKAAALTYVAAVASSLLQLLRLAMLVNGGSGRRRR